MKSNYVYVTPRRGIEFGLMVFAHIGYKDPSVFKVSKTFISNRYIPKVCVPFAQDWRHVGRIYLN